MKHLKEVVRATGLLSEPLLRIGELFLACTGRFKVLSIV